MDTPASLATSLIVIRFKVIPFLYLLPFYSYISGSEASIPDYTKTFFLNQYPVSFIKKKRFIFTKMNLFLRPFTALRTVHVSHRLWAFRRSAASQAFQAFRHSEAFPCLPASPAVPVLHPVLHPGCRPACLPPWFSLSPPKPPLPPPKPPKPFPLP